MITFRQHLVTIISVFVALAVGIVLGGGLLSDIADSDQDSAAVAGEPTPGAAGDAFSAAFAASVGPGLVAGRLSDQQVALVTLPGADETQVVALSEQVAAAGGTVTGTLRLTQTLTDPAQKSLVDTLGSQLMAQQPKGGADAASPTYVRIGQLFGQAITNQDATSRPTTPKTQAVLESLIGAGLLEQPETLETRAPLVLVVLGDEPAADGGDAILAGIVEGIGSRAAGTVVAGTVADGLPADGTDGDEGQLAALRAVPGTAMAATVDGIDVPAGQTVTMLALARSVATDGGSFGAAGTDGPLPLG